MNFSLYLGSILPRLSDKIQELWYLVPWLLFRSCRNHVRPSYAGVTPPSRVHLTVHRILQRSHAWPPSEAPRRLGMHARGSRVYARAYPRLPHHENNTHIRKRERENGAHTTQCVTQKIRDPDTRARHVSRRINEGVRALLSSFSCLFLRAREICCGKCRYVDGGRISLDCELCRYAPSSPAA